MADETVDIAIRIRDGAKSARELRANEAAIKGIDTSARSAATSASRMGSAVSVAANTGGRGLEFMGRQAKYASIGIAGIAVAGAKWGLGFNAQVEQSRLRFSLFTKDVDGLMESVKTLDTRSVFGLGELSESAARLGGSGIKDVPKVLQAVANAAAGGGKGADGLQSISLALSQIQSKGRLSQEEVNQLVEGGAITAQQDLAKGLGLTAKQLQNLGGEGIEASKAIDVLTKAWTTGPMASMAEKQTKTLTGQWNMATGNARKFAGVLTEDLAGSLRDDVLPAANKVVEQMTKIFADDSLTSEQKVSRAVAAIRKGLGPLADQIGVEIKKADLPKSLGEALDAAGPVMLDAGKEAAGFFVDAFTEAPVWAQVLTAAWLGKKLFGGAGASAATGIGKGIGAGIGRGVGEKVAKEMAGTLAGRLAEGFLGRGGTPANPLFVLDVGGAAGVGAGGKGARGRGAAPKRRLPGVLKVAGPVGVAVTAAEIGHALFPNVGRPDLPTRGSAPVARQAAGTIPAPGYGTGPVGALAVTNVVNIDGKTVSRSTAVTDAIENGRLAASRAARK